MSKHDEARRAFLIGAAVGAGAAGAGLVPDALAQTHHQHQATDAQLPPPSRMRMARGMAPSSTTTMPPPLRRSPSG